MLAFRIQGPHDLIGRVTADIIDMRGQMEPAQIESETFTLCGRVPLATSMDYVIRLSSLSSGRASLSTQYDGFDPVPTELGAVRPYRGISPLDRAKYILWWRGAITDATTSRA
jgi:ribosomal protection tetracycline resistance protein